MKESVWRGSVANPGCFPPDPDLLQRILPFLTLTTVSKLSEKYLRCSSRIQIFFHPGSRGQKTLDYGFRNTGKEFAVKYGEGDGVGLVQSQLKRDK
jgi:hypothetical protein